MTNKTITAAEEPDLLEQVKRDFGAHVEKRFSLEILHYVERFVKTQDYNWIDLILWRFTSEKFPLLRSIQILAARVA